MSRAQLHKSLKAFGHPPTFEQQSQLIILQQQFESAEQALNALEANAPAVAIPQTNKDPELKRAKIQLAMRRAELKKPRTRWPAPNSWPHWAQPWPLLNRRCTLPRKTRPSPGQTCNVSRNGRSTANCAN